MGARQSGPAAGAAREEGKEAMMGAWKTVYYLIGAVRLISRRTSRANRDVSRARARASTHHTQHRSLSLPPRGWAVVYLERRFVGPKRYRTWRTRYHFESSYDVHAHHRSPVQVSTYPFERASWRVCSSHGQPFSRAHCSTSRYLQGTTYLPAVRARPRGR